MTTDGVLREPSSAGRAGSRMVGSAAAVAWLIGFVSNFLIAPTNTGMGVEGAYASFQIGSNVGNVLALVLWSCTALLALWLIRRSSGATWIRAFVAYGVPAVLSLYPSAVVSNAVAHVVALEDSFVYHDWLAWPLILSGIVALMVALLARVLNANGGRGMPGQAHH